MPQLHPSRHTGRRLLAGGLLGAVVVLGTPAVASAETPGLPGLADLSGILESADNSAVVPADGLPSLPAGAPDFAGTAQAFASCLTDAGADITVALTNLGTGLQDALLELLTGGIPGLEIPGVELPTDATTGTAQGQFTLSRADLESMAADGETELPMVVTVIVNGVEQVVRVVVDLATCLAALIPTPAPAAPVTTTPPAAAPTTTVAPAITTSAAPTQAVAYPGYAPTGGAPTEDDGSPAALVGLGLLTAATGGGALWLRARRGVA